MSAIAWQQDPNGTWDIIILGGEHFSGAVSLTGRASRKLELKGRRGFDGRVINDAGYQNADVDISLSVATQNDFDKLQKLLGDVHPRKKGGLKKPLTLVHPAPNLLGIFEIYIYSVDLPAVANGILTVKLKAKEWVPVPVEVIPKKIPKGAQEIGGNLQICSIPNTAIQRESGTLKAVACMSIEPESMTMKSLAEPSYYGPRSDCQTIDLAFHSQSLMSGEF